MAKSEQVLLGAFAAIEGAHFYSSFLPSIMTIDKFADDERAISQLRQGEILASGFALGLGWVVSELIDDYTPLIFSIATVILMVSVYESAIRGKLNLVSASAIGAAAALPFGV